MEEEFENISPEEEKGHENPQEAPVRVRLPKKNEVIGIVVQRLGGNRMEIKSTDGKTRNCRVPGRFKRKFWLRPGDLVIITPWEFDDSKGDIIFQYHKNASHLLRKRGMLKNLEEGF